MASSVGFAIGDEIFIDEQVAPPGNPRSEINEIENISGDTWTLVRDHKNYSSGKPVRKVRELGAVQPDRSSIGLAIYIRKSGNDLVFQDNTGGQPITLQQIRQGLGLP